MQLGTDGRVEAPVLSSARMKTLTPLAAAIAGATLATVVVISAQSAVAPAPAPDACGSASAAQLRTTLYFGTTQERAKVLLLVHADSEKAKTAVQDLITRYRKMFEQESVLWETARVCVA